MGGGSQSQVLVTFNGDFECAGIIVMFVMFCQ